MTHPTPFHPTPSRPWKLITIPISHYCEKARWAIDRLSFPYVEQPHMLPFHRSATQAVGGTSVPVLVTDTGSFTDSTEILRYLDTLTPKPDRLYPSDAALRQQVETLETVFNLELGPETRRWGYFHILDNDEILHRQWGQGIPPREQALFPKMLPKLRTMVREALNISAASATNALEIIHRIFASVNDRLADGRPYLVGDQFTAADLTFAALAAPMLLPPEHPMSITGFKTVPEPMAREIATCRRSPAGKFVLRLYRDRPSVKAIDY